jgi:hypothetical protein
LPARGRFSRNLERAAGRCRVFLFVLDSLRRDYLSPFNRAVRFTPQIDRFASKLCFDNAFTLRRDGARRAVDLSRRHGDSPHVDA